MTYLRRLVIAGALGVMVGACSGQDGQTSTGSGGSPGTGGTSPQGGTTGSAGTGGSAGSTTGTGTGGSMSTAGTTGTGGSMSTAGTTGTGGISSTGGQSGATSTGGAGRGGAAGTMGLGGRGGSGAAGAAGMGASGGSTGTGGAMGPKNVPVPSAGCGKATTVTSGTKTITSTGQARTYIIDIPTNYDMTKPYRFFYTSHWLNGTADQVKSQNYYGLKPLATAANEPAIFVAPQGINNTWMQADHALFDDILALVKENLCIDTTRVFATGFSFGGMITYSLSVNHQKDIRAGVGIAPANYNIYLPTKTRQPIAWMQTTGMSDTTCPWVNGSSTTQGAKYIAIEKAMDSGCTVPATIPTWQSGNHVCYDFAGCQTGYPTKACTFNGGHTSSATDSGTNTNWIPAVSWEFFTQF